MTSERIQIVLDCLRDLSREYARDWNPRGNDDGLKGIHNLGIRHCLEDAITFITEAQDHVSAVDEENHAIRLRAEAAESDMRFAEQERDAAAAAIRESAAKICREAATYWYKFVTEGKSLPEVHKPAWLSECANKIDALPLSDAGKRLVEDAEMYRALRTGATNVYPYPFIAVRDPSSTVIQLSGKIADEHVARLIKDTNAQVAKIIDAARAQEGKS